MCTFISIVLSICLFLIPVEGSSVRRRLSFSGALPGDRQVNVVAEQGSKAFIEALMRGEYADTYDLPLHTFEVVDKDTGELTNLASIIGNLDASNPNEKKIIAAYFSKDPGLEYLRGILGDMDIEQIADFISGCTYIAEFVDPFTVMIDMYSLGYYVEMNILKQDTYAQQIKDRYADRWNTYRTAQDNNPEISLLNELKEWDLIENTIKHTFATKGIQEVVQGFLTGTIPDKAYDADLDELIVVTRNGQRVSLISLIYTLLRQNTADRSHTTTFYQRYVDRGGRAAFQKVMVRAKKSQDFQELAEQIAWSPSLAKNIFHPEIDLEESINACAAQGDSAAQSIKEFLSPSTIDAANKYYHKARHLATCIANNALDDEGVEILKAPDEASHQYVEYILQALPDIIDGAVQGDDKDTIDEATAWLVAVDKAGKVLTGSPTNEQYRMRLASRKNQLVQAAALNQKVAQEKPEVIKPWLTPARLFFIGSVGLICYFIVDHIRVTYQKDEPQRTTSFVERHVDL